MANELINKELIMKAWTQLRKTEMTIPDETLDFMRNVALEKCAEMKTELKCVPGCKYFEGGEIKHHEDCPHYPESFSQMYDDLKNEFNVYKEKMGEILDRERFKWYKLGAADEANEKYDCLNPTKSFKSLLKKNM